MRMTCKTFDLDSKNSLVNKDGHSTVTTLDADCKTCKFVYSTTCQF